MAQRSENSLSKAQYFKPTLAIYGEFANLTAGGVGSIVEGQMGSGLMMQRA
jgi:hypothetical protein